MSEQDVYDRFLAAILALGGQRNLANRANLTPSYINDMVHKRRPISDRMLKVIGIERVVTVEYREIEGKS